MTAPRVNRDSEIVGKVITPGGLIVRIVEGDLPESIRERAREGYTSEAALALASLTGCRATVEVRHVATAEPGAPPAC